MPQFVQHFNFVSCLLQESLTHDRVENFFYCHGDLQLNSVLNDAEATLADFLLQQQLVLHHSVHVLEVFHVVQLLVLQFESGHLLLQLGIFGLQLLHLQLLQQRGVHRVVEGLERVPLHLHVHEGQEVECFRVHTGEQVVVEFQFLESDGLRDGSVEVCNSVVGQVDFGEFVLEHFRRDVCETEVGEVEDACFCP